jgi:hypothetical protein
MTYRALCRRADRLAPAGYIVANNEAIWGTGDTADAAWADMLANLEPGTVFVAEDEEVPEDGRNWTCAIDYRIAPATAGLLAKAEDAGGAIAWDYVHGVACLPDEDWEPEYEHEERDAP